MQKRSAKLIKQVIKPIIDLLLIFGVDYKTFSTISKEVYISIAAKRFGKRKRLANNSRISIATGISRREVSRIKQLLLDKKNIKDQVVLPLQRVIDLWIFNKNFHDQDSLPKLLSYDDGNASFCKLVGQSRINVTPKSVMDELERLGLIELNREGKIRLLQNKIINDSNEDIFHARLNSFIPN